MRNGHPPDVGEAPICAKQDARHAPSADLRECLAPSNLGVAAAALGLKAADVQWLKRV